MTSNPSVFRSLLGVGALALAVTSLPACSAVGLDILSVVQETNMPGDPCEGHPHVYTRDITPTCERAPFTLTVCATGALCPAQVDGIAAVFTACAEPPAAWDPDDLPRCE